MEKRHSGSSISNLVLHHDNARPHTAKHTKDYIDVTGFKTINFPPYSPDLAPCDFWLFPRIKGALAGRIFSSIDDVQVAWNEELIKLQPEDFNKCFNTWFDRMNLVIPNFGNYI